MTKKRNDLSALALFILMLFCILCMVMLGNRLYAALVAAQNDANAQRASLAYVAQQLRSYDEAGAVRVDEGPQGDMLVLTDKTAVADYETRIYWYDGSLMEEYQRADVLPDPAQAQAVAQTDSFAVTLQNGLVQVTTGEGQELVYLHSGEGAA